MFWSASAIALAAGDDPMKSDAERCKEWERFRKIDAAFRTGDLAALRAAVDDPGCVPNGPMPRAIGPCLEYAIYQKPHAACAGSVRYGP